MVYGTVSLVLGRRKEGLGRYDQVEKGRSGILKKQKPHRSRAHRSFNLRHIALLWKD
tara:strand:- start:401 stop:571 length:171 start_codon:yes stop_codon:yes gene_type:complete